MTAMQQKAVELIKHLSDEKLYYVVQILEGIEGLTAPAAPSAAEGKMKEQKADPNVKQFLKRGNVDFDYTV